MKILFVHQNAPAQFKHLAPHLAAQGHKVAFITRREDVKVPGVNMVRYKLHRAPRRDLHPYLLQMEEAVLGGQGAVRAALSLRKSGFEPDIVVSHPGWGETLFLKDVFPKSPLVNYCEFYYRAFGHDVHFDPAETIELDRVCRTRVRAGHLLLALEASDRGLAPTHWQKSTHPEPLRDRIEVIFDGIDSDTVRPDPRARFVLPDGTGLGAGDPIVTYVARNLEPYRGFPTFIRSLPRILEGHPGARVLVVGGDDVSYGAKPASHPNWREAMLAEVPLDLSRVHFLGKLPYDQYLKVLQVSAVHVYLTVPFVLSWSLMEALAAGCLVVGSDTAPVREVIEDGRNGRLADFFRPDQVAEQVLEALAAPERFRTLRLEARRTVLERYALKDCLSAQVRFLKETAGRA